MVQMYDDLPRAQLLERMSREMLDEPGEQATLDRIVKLAAETIPACDACGISIRYPDGGVDTPACTSDMVAKADGLQYEFSQGPCLDAIWKLDTYVIDDLRVESRWPQWAPAAADLGFRSIASVRLNTPENLLGGLNLYGRTPRAFDHTDVIMASIFARHAANALQITRRTEGLHKALQTRQAIGVAQGMLMQRYGLDLDQSFEVLRRYSQHQNVKLRDLCEQIVLAGSLTDGIDQLSGGTDG